MTSELREALTDAAVAFEMYADSHQAKAGEMITLGHSYERDSRLEKAERNRRLGKQMRAALAALNSQRTPDMDGGQGWGAWLTWHGRSRTGPNLETEERVEVIRRGPNATHYNIAERHHIDWWHTGGPEDVLLYRRIDAHLSGSNATQADTDNAALVEAATRSNKRTRQVRKHWKVTRSFVEANLSGTAFAKEVPKWAHHVAFFGFAEQGWSASVDGEKVATGQWGDELWLLKNGTLACNEYPKGWSAEAAIEKGRIKWEAEKAALSNEGAGHG